MEKLLQTDRLYLREFTLMDAPLLLDMHGDPDITRYTGDPLPWDSLEQTEKVLREAILPQYALKVGRWAVHLAGNDTFIGWCGLKWVNDEYDIGYRFIKKYWGNGYATESAKAVLGYGVQRRLDPIVGCAATANKASVRVLEKIGLTHVEHYQEHDVPSVKYRYVYR
jgi:RimJ/RimL family protein N-acetyltransferase